MIPGKIKIIRKEQNNCNRAKETVSASASWQRKAAPHPAPSGTLAIPLHTPAPTNKGFKHVFNPTTFAEPFGRSLPGFISTSFTHKHRRLLYKYLESGSSLAQPARALCWGSPARLPLLLPASRCFARTALMENSCAY